MIEEELQLILPESTLSELPKSLIGLNRGEIILDVHEDEYFDLDEKVAKAGMSLRIRREQGAHPVWTLKLPDETPGGALRSRKEMEWVNPDDDIKQQAIRELKAIDVDLDLVKSIGIIKVNREKSQYTDREGKPVLELAWDDVEYPDGTKELRVEIEGMISGAPLYGAAEVLVKLVGGASPSVAPTPAKLSKVQTLALIRH